MQQQQEEEGTDRRGNRGQLKDAAAAAVVSLGPSLSPRRYRRTPKWSDRDERPPNGPKALLLRRCA